MDSNGFQQIVALLLEIKRVLQKGGTHDISQLTIKIDKCISKVIPYLNAFPKQPTTSSLTFTPSHKSKSLILPISQPNVEIHSQQFNQLRKSTNQDIKKVQHSFLFKEPRLIQNRVNDRQSILQDYFVLRFNLGYNDYEVYGREGATSDRKVFVDLLTFDNKRAHTSRLEKTESMTNILKEIFSQSKPSQPFILPNFQGDKAKYLFVFTLPECASIAKQYYRTETICCFMTHDFILGQLTQLMGSISSTLKFIKGVCFQQQVNQASQSKDCNLSQTISFLYGKKTYKCMERVIENYLNKRQDVTKSKLFNTKIERPLINSIQEHLEHGQELWSLVRQEKTQELIQTLVLLYYLALCQYKIILLANTKNKHLISDLVLGLTRALHPLTYIYPIVGTTITPHHFEFANSPVPILVGFWGSQRDYNAAKSSLKKVINTQKDMSASQLATQTLMVVVDLQDHSLHLFDKIFKESVKMCKNIQRYLQAQTAELTCIKLSYLTKQLLDGKRDQEWMLTLTKNLKVTQMYDYLIYRK